MWIHIVPYVDFRKDLSHYIDMLPCGLSVIKSLLSAIVDYVHYVCILLISHTLFMDEITSYGGDMKMLRISDRGAIVISLNKFCFSQTIHFL